MKKIILGAVAALVLVGGGGGGALVYIKMTGHHSPPAHPKPPPPKPLLFGTLENMVVSVPLDSSAQAGQGFVQISIQYATTDQKAIDSFNALLPIIKAETITLLMKQTAKQLMDPSTHDSLTKTCVTLANQVLDKNAGFTPPDPFTAAYITNIVQQD
ncbi:flagellar basal body-associated FliL family protein [Acidocella facilis]|uniref:flagellar basal body-associated FliL family protein n=1 Tax=Acidocella facilis TaxID=525 RepID=UPI001F1F060E|nr:flagellar basal body-associated FliL family protein [Acidocella facilis]